MKNRHGGVYFKSSSGETEKDARLEAKVLTSPRDLYCPDSQLAYLVGSRLTERTYIRKK